MMKQLSPNWFAEGTLDAEHKQYVLLAYLQAARQQYSQTKLYPALSDLIFHYENLQQFWTATQQLAGSFPRELTEVDLQQLRLVYHSPAVADDSIMPELEQIVQFSIPRLREAVDEGRDLYEQVDSQMHIEPVGVVPLYQDEGYVLMRLGNAPAADAYRYRQSVVLAADGQLRSLELRYLATYALTLATTYERIKLELVHTRPQLPNPATYALECPLPAPLNETLLPIARRKLLYQLVKVKSAGPG